MKTNLTPILLAGAICAAISATADTSAEKSARATAWMSGKAGVFMHYLVKSDDDLAAAVSGFDVDGVVRQLVEMRADWFCLTLGQNTGYYISPNNVYESIADYPKSSRCSRRDIPAEFIRALKPHGIRFLLYLPCQTPNSDAKAAAGFGFGEAVRRGDRRLTSKGVANWAKVIEEWSRRYGDGLSGWWFDGAYDFLGFGEDVASVYSAAAKAGNGDAVVAFNSGLDLSMRTRIGDYAAGEISKPFGTVCKSRFEESGLQWHALTYLGDYWQRRNCRYPTERWREWVSSVLKNGGAVTLDMGHDHPSGLFDAEQAKQFRQLKARPSKSASREECRNGAFIVGQATSMENVRPRADVKWRKADRVGVRLARGESESVQILVSPADHDLKDVNVEVESDLRYVSGGSPFSASNVTVSVVGYVQTTNAPNYKVRLGGKGGKFATPPVGWWPDPILDFQKTCDVSGRDVQSFWVRVACPRNQKAGIYRGALVVSAKDEKPVRIPFAVRVYDFEVGSGSPLPLAITCNVPGCNIQAMGYRTNVVERLRNDPDSYHKAYKTRENAYSDFFADYFITRSSIYAMEDPGGEPYWDYLVRLRDEGRLGMFCLFYFRALPPVPDGEAVWRKRFMSVMKRRYDKAKELGILDKAYFYGCDEFNPPTFTNVQAAAEILHREFPGVPVMTTARDVELGTGGSILKDIDIHCPAVCFWEKRPVAEAQHTGRQVWWYFCNTPTVPWANTMLEGPPAEIRSLMGAQTQKFKPDGFLYYATMKWNSEFPIVKGPFTDWTPATGDGQWTCCGGPDLLPLATIRLENFRDGLEDLWYVRELEKRLAAHGDKYDAWATAAKAALAVPDEVARSVKDFSTDSDVIYRWRDGIADLIENAR